MKFIILILSVLILFSSCGGDESSIPEGALGSSCRDGSDCNDGLICSQGACAEESYDFDGDDYAWVKFWDIRCGTAKVVAANSTDDLFVFGNDKECTNYNDNTSDLFLSKISKDSDILWEQKWGSDENDFGEDIEIDNSGNLLIAGTTEGSLDGLVFSESGQGNIFLSKFNSNGNELWTKQWGNNDDKFWYYNHLSVVSDDNGNIYLSGWENFLGNGLSSFLIKFSEAGDEIWTYKRFNGPITVLDISDSGDILIIGDSDNDGASYLTKISSEGVEEWKRPWGGKRSYTHTAIDSNDNIITLHESNTEYLLTKFDSDGVKLWSKSFDIDKSEGSHINIDSNNNIFLSTKRYYEDILLLKFNSTGELVWEKNWGIADQRGGESYISIDSLDNLFVLSTVDCDLSSIVCEGNKNFLIKVIND